jgi:hypothetical protein
MTRFAGPILLLATAAGSTTVEPSASRTAGYETAPTCTVSNKAASCETTSLKTVSVKAARVGASISMSPAVIPRACADEDAAREPAWAIESIGRASIGIIWVIAVGADWWASHNADAADSDSDSDLSLRVRERHGQ